MFVSSFRFFCCLVMLLPLLGCYGGCVCLFSVLFILMCFLAVFCCLFMSMLTQLPMVTAIARPAPIPDEHRVPRYLSTRLYIRWNRASAIMLIAGYKGAVCALFVFYDPLVQACDTFYAYVGIRWTCVGLMHSTIGSLQDDGGSGNSVPRVGAMVCLSCSPTYC